MCRNPLATLPAAPRFDCVSRRIPLHLFWLFVLTPQLSAGLCAQQEPTLERGSQIELVSERLPGGVAVGWLETLTKDTLTFVNSLGLTAVPLEEVGQLRVNIGRDKSSINTVTLMGAIVGAVFAPLMSPESYECRYGLVGEDECGEMVPTEVVGALFGAAGFRMLAKFTTPERWVNVSLDRLLYSVSAPNRP